LFADPNESVEEFESFGQELPIEFEEYTSSGTTNMRFLRAVKEFLTKERTSPFELDVPRDFVIAQWGI
jgi:hypothetical protein